MVKFEDVSMTYPSGTRALKNVSMHIKEGEFVFVVGTSGSGKSTFLKLIQKELAPSAGRIMVKGRYIDTITHKEVPEYRRNMGVVFQDFRLLKDRTVFENVALAGLVVGASKKDIRIMVPSILKQVGIEDKQNILPTELSGGEQQRVALARALVNKPKFLLADEPTGNLDPENSWEIMELLKKFNDNGTTVIVVTHNREIVDNMKKRVIVLDHGQLVSDQLESGYSNEG